MLYFFKKKNSLSLANALAGNLYALAQWSLNVEVKSL